MISTLGNAVAMDGYEPLVSVVVPSYNHISYIEDCLISIFQQDYPKLQVIVIDDGSSDGSLELLQSLNAKYPFELLSQVNRGLLPTLNRALELVKGEYFVPIASDDLMMPGRITRQVAHLKSEPRVAICGGNIVPINEDGQSLPQRYRFRPARRLDFDAVFCGTLAGAPAPSMMLRTAVVREVGGYDESLRIEDLLMMLKVTRAGYWVDVLEDDLSYYRSHGKNMHSNLEFMFLEILRVYSVFSDHDSYQKVCYFHRKSYFIKASKVDSVLARRILAGIPIFAWNIKVVRGVLRMLMSAGGEREKNC